METKEELNAIKEEIENLSKKLNELTEEELAQVIGGLGIGTASGEYGIIEIDNNLNPF